MLNKNSKRAALEKIARQEVLGLSRSRDVKIFNCGYSSCPIVTPAKKVSNIPSAIQDSAEFMQHLEDFKSNHARDHLGIGDQIVSSFFEQEGIKDEYEIPEKDPLEDTGIHITSNPGFSYH